MFKTDPLENVSPFSHLIDDLLSWLDFLTWKTDILTSLPVIYK